MNPVDDAFHAARLVQWGLRPLVRPAQEPEYLELVHRYRDESSFRALVHQIADGLELHVLDVSVRGIVVSARSGSEFDIGARAFRPSMKTPEDRLLDGLVQLAIAATLFPLPRDLEDDATIARPPVTVAEVDENLRAICMRLEEESRNREANDRDPGLTEAFRVYLSRPMATAGRVGKTAMSAAHGVIEYNLERLREHGCFTPDRRGETVCYQPTWRYQVLVRELAAAEVFDRVRRALAAEEGS